MPQKTNLNINPYYDDYDPDKNFHKVLFKPGYPIQARELTGLQSIFQHQIESFGRNIFKDGSMVIPGSITYDDQYFSVKINPDHLGIDVTIYLESLINKNITGQTSGIEAVVKKYSIPPEDNVSDITLYIKYLAAGTNGQIEQFTNGELLVLQDTVSYGNTTINSGDTVATIISENATAIGSAVGVDKGVYFIRGSFVDVPLSLIVLDPYSNRASYRVGFSIFEEIITSDEDSSLNDNARGFSNYSAPGADRFKISTILSKKSLDDFNDTNFIEIIRIENGQIKKLQDKSTYSIIRDYLAQRTYEESGDYAVNGFQIDILESLNNQISNGGIYLPNQKTQQGNTPSDDLMCVKISDGKAYVRGYDVDLKTTIIDVEKPRDTQSVSSALVPFEMGNLVRVNNVSGTPFIGINTSGNTVDLYNQRKNSTVVGTGISVGKARVYSFGLADAPYANEISSWNLYLYDIQTFTTLTLSESLTSAECPISSYVRGLGSGATGYVVNNPSGKSLTLTQVSGSFISGEQIIINENLLNSRYINIVTNYTVDDVKSIYQNSTSITSSLKKNFVADVELISVIPSTFNVFDRLTIEPSGIATCGKSFLGIRSDSIVSYQISGLTTSTYNRVASVSSDGFTMNLVGIPSVFGICNGGLPTTKQTVPFTISLPSISATGSLYAPLGNLSISSVDLTNSNILVSTQINNLQTDVNGQMSVTVENTGISSAFFATFDPDRYSIFYSDGTIENLTSDQVYLSSNGSVITFVGLKISQSLPSNPVTLNATLIKRNSTSKIKNYVRSEKLSITKTSSGVSTSISGLTTSPYYGLRIEDSEICLNVPDVSEIVAVYESLDKAAPVLDRLTFSSGLNLDTQSILGERIVGQNSGSIAQLVSRLSSNEVEFVYLNAQKFIVGETITFEESRITSDLQALTLGSYLNISSRYGLDTGHREQYCDYSRIVRSRNATAPSRQILVIFNFYQIPSDDTGDFVTVNSYSKDRYSNNIPVLPSGLRSSDALDFRPRVIKFNSTNKSPFAFDSQIFVSSSQYTAITPNESSIVGYSHYLPRIDRVVLNKLGEVYVIKGTSSIQPRPPVNVEDAMDLALISLPPYLYNTKSAAISLVDNRRFTMRDIGGLVDRVENLELTTSLSLLELDTKTLQIRDSSGINRFKTGFFVDNFRDMSFVNIRNPDTNCDVDTSSKTLIPPNDFWSLKAELGLDPSINVETADFGSNLKLLDPNLKKTGELITLNYTEVEWLKQPFATTRENVNPFQVTVYAGAIKLYPASDNWVRTVYLNDIRVTTKSYTTTTVSTTNTKTNSDVLTTTDVSTNSETSTSSTTTSGQPLIAVPTVVGGARYNYKTKQIDYAPTRGFPMGRVYRRIVPFRGEGGTGGGYQQFPGFTGGGGFGMGGGETFFEVKEDPGLTVNRWVRGKGLQKIKVSGSGKPAILNKTTSNSVTNSTTSTTSNTFTSTESTSTTTSTTSVVPTDDYDYVEGIKTSGETDPYMRKRNVEFRGGSLMPLTQHYASLNDISSLDIIPKLIEIKMNSGSFIVGEDVWGFDATGHVGFIKFRCAAPNHKDGPYNSPTSTYTINPYSRANDLLTTYSSSSTVLNVDTFSLSEESITSYGGYIEVGMLLIGTTSGAEATVTNNRLITDDYGDIIGTFFIRDPNTDPPPSVKIKTGSALFKLTASETNTRIESTPGNTIFGSNAEVTYSGSGIIQTQLTQLVQVRNPPSTKAPHRDPLAQTFTVDETGAFLTSVDVYFANKDPNKKLTVEIRTVDVGARPSNQLVQDYATVDVDPKDIQVSSDASKPTRITFPSPIYLQAKTEYAIVFICASSDKYEIWTAQKGLKTVNSQYLPDNQKVVGTQPYIGGSLFKSQNGTLWSENQEADITFKFYKAKFNTTPGDVVFYNPPIRGNETTAETATEFLKENAIKTLPRKLKVGITTTSSASSILKIGTKVSNGSISSPGAYGLIEFIGGPLSPGTSGVSIANTGIGYSGGTSGQTYNNVPLYTITGQGSGATATITITSTGFLNTVSIANTGNGYQVGDILGITTTNVTKGSDAKISVSTVNGIDTLYLTSVQGEVFNNGNNLIYYNGNTAVSISNVSIRGNSYLIDDLYSGNVFEIFQRNHGMHATNNKVEIKNILPDTPPIKLTSNLDLNSTTISVASTASFATFEGISTSFGYVLVDNEIISYNSVGNGVLGINSRGLNGTISRQHLAGNSVCYKYELNGVSLTKINTVFDMPTNPSLVKAKDFDKYHLEFDRGNRGTGDTQLNFIDQRIVGGKDISAHRNYQYTSIIPQFNVITPGKDTTVSAQMRTVSGTSCGGSEVSFQDQNYENVQLNAINFLSSPRLICSEINEVSKLTNIPRNKSLTFRIRMSSGDPNLSPVLDLQSALFVIARNRINNPISDYAADGRVNRITGDPHSAIYISNRVDVINPAKSLRVIVSASRPLGSDFRVLYQLFKVNSSEVDPGFTLFPGYENLDNNTDGFISPTFNNGKPDSFMRESVGSEFLEYVYTVDNLDPFTGFAIKIVMSSTNEALVPRFKDLRVIALA